MNCYAKLHRHYPHRMLFLDRSDSHPVTKCPTIDTFLFQIKKWQDNFNFLDMSFESLNCFS